MSKVNSVKRLVFSMKKNAPMMAASSHEKRVAALLAIKEALISEKEAIFKANHSDIERAKAAGVAPAIIKRLKFDEAKLESVVAGIDTLVGLEDPVGRKTLSRELNDGLILQRISVPIGVIGVIFEARPDALVQISTLCIKSGNMCILKGGKETEETNGAIFDVIYEAAISAGLPEFCLVRVSKHNEIDELLTCHGAVDLIIPRGSNEFVKYIMDNTSIPVLGHADGICHTYVDSAADIKLAIKVCLDAKTQYPAACNATETILVAEDIAKDFLPGLSTAMEEAGVKIRVTKDAARFMPDAAVEIIDDGDFRNEYLELTVAIKLVKDVEEAVNHINFYSSHHTESIITQDEKAWDYFASMVDSAGVYKNASTRFADGFRYGFGAEVGISTSKVHARGPVGIDGLMTYKYLLRGEGHTVGDFESGKRKYSFKDFD